MTSDSPSCPHPDALARFVRGAVSELELETIESHLPECRRCGDYVETLPVDDTLTDLLQGTGQPPERCIWIVEAGKEPRKLCSGPYFWHSAASYDGEWIVADTSWPDVGLKLIHVPTGHWRTLCHPLAEHDHAGVHPHPSISQDGRKVVFASDWTGVSQVYVAHVTDEFRESVIAGELDRPQDKWM